MELDKYTTGGSLSIEDKITNTNIEDTQKESRSQALDITNLEFADALTGHVMQCFQAATDHKQDVIVRFDDAMHARRGEYTPQKLSEIRAVGGSAEYARLVANKARVLEAWLRDIYLGQAENPWTLAPTPIPTLPGFEVNEIEKAVSQELAAQFAAGAEVDLVQAATLKSDKIDKAINAKNELAAKRVRRMQSLIEDQLLEGGYSDAMADFIGYLVTYPAAILKGPVFRTTEDVNWVIDEAGDYTPKITEDVAIFFEAVNPYNIYPSPDAVTTQDGFMIEHSTISYDDLYSMIGVEGYDEDIIRGVLKQHPTGYRWVSDYVNMRNGRDVREGDQYVGIFDMLEFHGPVLGKDLSDWGEDVDDEDKHYEATVYIVAGEAIKAIINPELRGQRPYFKACYEDVPDEFWGMSLYDNLSDLQNTASAALRTMNNNAAISSGPQVGVNIEMLLPDEELNMEPWKIWQFKRQKYGNHGNERLLEFYQPESHTTELLNIMDKMYAMADDASLIPRYMQGNEKMSGPGRTASGLSMLLDAASKGLKSIVYSIDLDVISGILQQLYDYNMEMADDPEVKGDAQVKARGVSSVMQKEMLQMRRNDFYALLQTDEDARGIVGIEGKATLLRVMAQDLGMDSAAVVPSESELMEKFQREQAMQQEQMAAMQSAEEGKAPPKQSNERLSNGAPVTDLASPSPRP